MLEAVNKNELSNLHGKSIVLVSTVPFFLVNQLSSHIENLKSLGAKVTLVCSEGEELSLFLKDKSINVVTIEITRSINIWKDLTALYHLIKLFKKQSFLIMHSTTPKAGLLSALAGKWVGVPVCLHTFTGQVWATKKGFMKLLLQKMDQVIIHFNTHCYTDSPSQRLFLVESGVINLNEVSTYGKGSLAGVDLHRFSQANFSCQEKNILRSDLGISEDSFILIFVGRLTRDKGIYELLLAFQKLRRRHRKLEILILGPLDDESGKCCFNKYKELLGVHWLGYVENPEMYLAISDLLCLPSYREGFGTVVLEAASMGVPAVVSDISGLRDAVKDGVTGFLTPVKNVDALVNTIESILSDNYILESMRHAAKHRCKEYFDSAKVNNLVAEEYVRWLAETNL